MLPESVTKSSLRSFHCVPVSRQYDILQAGNDTIAGCKVCWFDVDADADDSHLCL